MGPRAASGAGGTGPRWRGVFRPSAILCIFCLFFFLAILNILQGGGFKTGEGIPQVAAQEPGGTWRALRRQAALET